ncbi:MAG: hypothetical protein M3N41_07625, partial [Acidobacteriota bacterium]|nr:hypothetical protein [Acidobacteriota bacterium]
MDSKAYAVSAHSDAPTLQQVDAKLPGAASISVGLATNPNSSSTRSKRTSLATPLPRAGTERESRAPAARTHSDASVPQVDAKPPGAASSSGGLATSPPIPMIPELSESPSRRNELERIPRYVPAPPPEIETQPKGLPFSHYLWVLRQNQWKILGFVTFCMLATWLVCSRMQPVYEATARVDVDRRAPTGVVGKDAMESSVGNDSDQFLTTQIELVQSDGVLRPVAQRYDLLKNEKQLGKTPGSASRTENAPIVLKNLKVVRPPNSFILRIVYRSVDPRLAADVANAIAASYLERTYDIRLKSTIGLSNFMVRQIDELKAKMERSGQALAVFEKELNVINADDKTNMLSSRLLQLNAEYTTAQGERVTREAAHNSLKTGALAAIQISPQADSLSKLQEGVLASRQRLAEIKSLYGPNYSEYKRAASQLSELERQYNETRAEIAQRI